MANLIDNPTSKYMSFSPGVARVGADRQDGGAVLEMTDEAAATAEEEVPQNLNSDLQASCPDSGQRQSMKDESAGDLERADAVNRNRILLKNANTSASILSAYKQEAMKIANQNHDTQNSNSLDTALQSQYFQLPDLSQEML